MANWVPVNQDRFMAPRKETIGGVEVEVVRSMFDLPIALRAAYDEKDRVVVIDLRYLGEEDGTKTFKIDHDFPIELRLDAVSGRIRQIRVPVPEGVRAGARDVTLRKIVEALLKSLDKFASSHNTLVRPDNVQVARTAIQDDKQ